MHLKLVKNLNTLCARNTIKYNLNIKYNRNRLLTFVKLVSYKQYTIVLKLAFSIKVQFPTRAGVVYGCYVANENCSRFAGKIRRNVLNKPSKS